jgi:hypothetical protein
MAQSFADKENSGDKYDKLNRRYNSLPHFAKEWFENEVRCSMNSQTTRAQAEAQVWREWDRRARIKAAEQQRLEAQENGTFGAVDEPVKNPSPPASPLIADEISGDFGLPQKEDWKLKDVLIEARKRFSWADKTIKNKAAEYFERDTQERYLLTRNEVIKFLEHLQPQHNEWVKRKK